MKRILFSLFILLSVCAGEAFAIQDQWGSERPALWRSTRTCVEENFVVIATGPIHLHAIVIDTPTVNSESQTAIFNSTTATTATFNFNIDTAAYMPSNMRLSLVNAAVADDVMLLQNIEWPKMMTYDLQLTSGAVINKVGLACSQVLWDYIDPRLSLRNQRIVPWKP